MGDAFRIQRLNNRIRDIDAMIMGITAQKHNLVFEMNENNVQGEEFFDFIQEIAELDQTIWDLKVEKQRLLDLI
jgi:hypothetical protein